MPTIPGTLLGGRLRYDQPADGYRTGLEPVLLAACVPARPGQRVLEGGTGAGAALMCLAARVPGLRGAGVELDPDMAALARRNLAANALDGLEVVAGDVLADAPAGPFDHALANPPWHDPAGTPPALPRRALAKHAPLRAPESAPEHAPEHAPLGPPPRGRGASPGGRHDEALHAWAAALGARLRRGGTLTLILPAARFAAGVAALGAGGCAAAALVPFWPHRGRPARLVVLQGTRGGRGPCRVSPGLVLHAPGGGFTPEADAVLRDGAAVTAG